MFAEKTEGATVDNNTLRLCSVRKVRLRTYITFNELSTNYLAFPTETVLIL